VPRKQSQGNASNLI